MFNEIDEDFSFMPSDIDDYEDLCNLADSKNDENWLQNCFTNLGD